MPSLSAGLYSAPAQLDTGAAVPLVVGGAFLPGASVLIIRSGTGTAPTYADGIHAVLYADAGYGTPLANPLPVAAGPGLPGVDGSSNLTFYSDSTYTYQAVVSYLGAHVPMGIRLVADAASLQSETTRALTAEGATAVTAAGAAQKAANLSDLANASIARTNLDLGTAATHPATDFDAAGLAGAAQAAAQSFATAAVATETTRATTAEGTKAPLVSPALTGTPTAPTAAALDSTTKLATTAYSDAATAVEKVRALAAEGSKKPIFYVGTPTADSTAAIDAASQAALAADGEVHFGAGTYFADHITLYGNVKYWGPGWRRCTVKPLSTSTSPGFVQLAAGPHQDIEVEGIHIVGNGVAGQHGVYLAAVETTPTNSGGMWYSRLARCRVDGFLGQQIWFRGGGVDSLAPHQFLELDHCQAFATGSNHALYLTGQTGQVEVNGGEYDGLGTPALPFAPTNLWDYSNICIRREVNDDDSNRSAEAGYTVAFRGTTAQKNGTAAYVEGSVGVTFDTFHSEQCPQGVVAAQGAIVTVGNASRFYNCANNGAGFAVGAFSNAVLYADDVSCTTDCDLVTYQSGGTVVPKDVSWAGLAAGIATATPPSSGLLGTAVGIASNGVLNLGYARLQLVQTNSTPIVQLVCQAAPGELVFLKAGAGPITLQPGGGAFALGNIDFGPLVTPLVVPQSGWVTLIRHDQAATASAWRILSVTGQQMVTGHTADSVPVSIAGALADLTMAASTVLARLASGDIVAATPAQIKTLLAIATGDVSGLGTSATHATSDFELVAGHANDSVPVSVSGSLTDLSMPASTFLARLAAGDVVAATVAQVKTLLALGQGDIAGLTAALALLAPIASPTFTGTATTPILAITGQTGAATASAYAGATPGGPPTSGTFTAGNWVVDVTNATIWVCTTGGSPGTWAQVVPGNGGNPTPESQGILGWTNDVASWTTAVGPIITGQAYASRIPWPRTKTVTNVSLGVTTIGSALTTGQCFVGLATSAGTLIAASADQAAAWGSTGLKTAALAGGAVSVTGGPGVYLLGLVLANGTTAPIFAGSGTLTSAINLGLSAGSSNLRSGSSGSGLTALPAGAGACLPATNRTGMIGMALT